jgi:hypothetical protein
MAGPPPPRPPELRKPVKKKVYAEVHATIRFKTDSKDSALKLAEHFLKRRGILGTFETEGKGRSTRVTMTVTYRVHGGWRSDFIRKIEYDAKDLGVEVRDLDINTERNEIPDQCPRKECLPCARAIDPSFTPAHKVQDQGAEEYQTEPDTVEPKRKWYQF